MTQRAKRRLRREEPRGTIGRDLHPAALLDCAATERLGRTIVVYDAVGSTNLAAMEAGLVGAPEGLLVIAEEQTLGRGRKGRVWSSARGRSLTFSILLRPVRTEEGLTALLALAAVRALDGLVADARIKWPNDVFLGGKKVGGILAEARGEAVVIGMGLNVNERPADFPAEIAGQAVSLRAAVGKDLDRGRVLCRILRVFERLYGRFQRDGFASFRAEVEARMLYVGEAVTIETGDERFRGRLLGITDGGYVRIAVAGQERTFSSGDLTVRKGSHG
jgi:BirA family biotin operon repressor/biotin-[acetyl-CoA-carboxylase] ligase